MVKIRGMTAEEEALFIKKSNLEKITRAIIKDENVCGILDAIGVDNGEIIVLPQYNKVIVSTPQRLRLARDLASTYENICNEEFTIKKAYSEN